MAGAIPARSRRTRSFGTGSVHPIRGIGSVHGWHVPLRFSPLPGRPAKSREYLSRHCAVTGRAGLRIRVCAGPRPDIHKVCMWAPAYPDRHRRFPSTWVGSAAFSRKLLKWGKKGWRSFPPARKHARGRVTIFQFILSCCHDNRQRAGQA